MNQSAVFAKLAVKYASSNDETSSLFLCFHEQANKKYSNFGLVRNLQQIGASLT
jgi:hypothetical protein